TNDLHGQQAGDALLIALARRLEAEVKGPSLVARLSGDEFMVVQLAGGEQPAAAAELAGRLLEVVRKPVRLGEQQARPDTSVGIALFPHDGRTGEALMANAEMALQRAKED